MRDIKKGSSIMKGIKRAVFAAFSLITAVSMSACGGGGGGTATPVTSKGAIEKVGSITVNGVKFDVKGAKLFLPDEIETAKQERILKTETEIVVDKLLKLGMVVTVKGTLDDGGLTGKATEIEFRDNLKARIDDVDLVNNTITVMGQKIALDDKIKPLLASLKAGDVVQISGLPDDKGGLRATFIEKKELAEVEHLTEFEMKGFVSNISADGKTATIKHDPAAATGVTVTFPVGTVLKDGTFIEVKVPKGITTFIPGEAIISSEAPHVEDIKVDPTPAGVQVSIEGFPSSIDAVANSFVLNGQLIKFDPLTITFVGGVKADLAITKKIQAEGVITGTTLNAVKITFKALPALANPGTSKGQIEALGSITVNGVKFNTTGAVLHLRDDKTTPDRILQTETELQDNNLLKPGMVVTVKGGFDDNGTTGTAREIEFRNTMEGKIDDKGVDFITVMGQKIIVDDKAKAVFDTLVKGDKVGLSGLPDDRGQIRATHIEKKADLAEFEAKGIISNLSGTTFTLLLDKNAATGMTVTFASGVLPAGAVNGAFVEVRTLSVGGVVTATKVELENELEAAENEKMEFEGFVASGTGDDFVVKGQRVQTTATTAFVGGIKADLVVGMKVEAEGNIVGGILIATKVMFNDNIRIDAIVGAVNLATATTQANLTLLGKKVIITSSTDLRGLSGTALDLSTVAGQEVQIRGFMAADNSGDIIATRVDLIKTDPAPLTFSQFLRGPVTAKDAVAGTLTIAGITVNTGTRFVDNKPIVTTLLKADFFNAITVNATAVKVTWDKGVFATSATVKEAELEI